MTTYEPIIPDGMLIDGAWHRGTGAFDDLDPSTGGVFASVPDAGVTDMDRAITAAKAAADDRRWSGRSLDDRIANLHQLAAALTARADEFAALGATEWGMTANERGLQIDVASYHVTDNAEKAPVALADQDHGRPDWGMSCDVMRAPHGVVAAITPWNFPHTINTQKLAPALVAGNTIVLKPSPLSPLAGLALAKVVAEETDIPPGVVNVVTTTDQAATELLTTDPRVAMVTFVGSAATARAVGAASAATMKRTLFELGGKSAAIYLDDFDVEQLTSQTVMDSCAMHAGQACILYSRLLVPDALHDAFVERLAELTAAVRVGSAHDPASEMGPVIDARSQHRILETIERAVSDGAKLVTGGGRPPGLDGGYFVLPTILDEVDNSWPIAQEEVFGPVTTVIRYRDIDDAVAIANDSAYGLIGAVHSPDADRARGVARKIDAGVVTVNGAPPYGPYGGWKQSGIGREGGVEGIRTYTEMRAVTSIG